MSAASITVQVTIVDWSNLGQTPLIATEQGIHALRLSIGGACLWFFNDHFYDGTAMQDMIKELISGSYHPCTTTNIDLNVYSLIFMVVFPCLRRG